MSGAEPRGRWQRLARSSAGAARPMTSSHPARQRPDAPRPRHSDSTRRIDIVKSRFLSARLVVVAGGPAVATTSAGMAFALGYPDGQRISRDEMLGSVAVVARAVDVPVTADMEAGYGDSPGDAAATARGVIAAGAVGLNVEDTADAGGLLPVEQFVAEDRGDPWGRRPGGVPLVLNARVDVFIGEIGEPGTRLEHAIERGRAYRECRRGLRLRAGRRGRVDDRRARPRDRRLCQRPRDTARRRPCVELARLGVARVSMGSGPYRAALPTPSARGRGVRDGYFHARWHPHESRTRTPSN